MLMHHGYFNNSLSLESGFHYVPRLIAVFFSHEIDMGNPINAIVG
jgi:hypothetical protein